MKKFWSVLLAAVCALPCMLGLVACGEEPVVDTVDHYHKWAGVWSSNETSHWRACTVEGCDATLLMGTHTWETGEADVEPTCITPGVGAHSCSTCKLSVPGGEIPATGVHNFSGDWIFGATGHYKTCSTEGCTETSTPQKHVEKEDWVFNSAAALLEYRCEICDGVVRTEKAPSRGTPVEMTLVLTPSAGMRAATFEQIGRHEYNVTIASGGNSSYRYTVSSKDIYGTSSTISNDLVAFYKRNNITMAEEEQGLIGFGDIWIIGGNLGFNVTGDYTIVMRYGDLATVFHFHVV